MKVVLLRADSLEIAAAEAVDQGVDQNALADKLLDRLLHDNGLERGNVRAVVATGYGRKLIHCADNRVTEITCHARGIRHLVPQARTIIDIGGQDSKLIWLGEEGNVTEFAMNDRCAAGTGRFLEVLAVRLGVPLQSLGEMTGRSRLPASISSMCVVFAETEIIGLLATGSQPEDIVAGVQASIATRVAAMASHAMAAPIVFTGGVAMVSGMAEALAAALGQPVSIAPRPQMTGALGAALIAADSPLSRERERGRG